jgi:general L-amino acid transport system permease protein
MYLPRKTLLLTALYPFVGFWLVWGGSLWVPLTVLAAILATIAVFRVVSSLQLTARQGLAAIVGLLATVGLTYLLYQGGTELWFISNSIGSGAGVFQTIVSLIFKAMSIFTFVFCLPMGLFVGYAIYNSYEDGGLVTIVTSAIAIYVMLAFGLGPISGALNGVVPLELTAVPSRDMGGYMLCLILGTVCVSLSLPLGIVLALGRQSNMPLIKGVCVVFIEFVRGVPLITLLFVANVMLAYFMPPQSNFDLILRVIIMITMFSAAYIAEVIRGGLAALPKGQYEAADSLGLNYTQATQLIILPQALKISIPGIVNVAVGLFKDTTLVSVISMFDIVGMIRGPIQQSTDWISIYWEVYLFAALVFFVVCYGISQYSQWLERRLATDHR